MNVFHSNLGAQCPYFKRNSEAGTRSRPAAWSYSRIEQWSANNGEYRRRYGSTTSQDQLHATIIGFSDGYECHRRCQSGHSCCWRSPAGDRPAYDACEYDTDTCDHSAGNDDNGQHRPERSDTAYYSCRKRASERSKYNRCLESSASPTGGCQERCCRCCKSEHGKY